MMKSYTKEEAIKAVEELFQDPEAAKRWIAEPARAFGGRTVAEVLETNPRLVIELVGKLEHGVFI